MLTWNVAGLLRSAPGSARAYDVHEPDFEIADDMPLAAPLDGQVRLSRTGRSILVHADVRTAISATCSRCLKAIEVPVTSTVDEEALPSIDIDSGQPLDRSEEPDALRIDDHHELDLQQPIREAISLAEPIAPLCRPDCAGLCPICGIDRNTDPDHRHDEASIDPRLAVLAAWESTKPD